MASSMIRVNAEPMKHDADQPSRLAVTMGDPSGVGPEVCLMLLQCTVPGARPIIYGDWQVLERVAKQTGLPKPAREAVYHIASLDDPSKVEAGRISSTCGQAAYTYLTRAIDDALAQRVDAIVTAPWNKEALHKAGIHYPGHTEVLTERTESSRSCMLQYSEEVTASFVTCHCGYDEVPKLLTRERLREVIDLTHNALIAVEGRPVKLVALGLNPHAGEHGLFGIGEEETIIVPELEAARNRGIDISGPVPPDTAFIPVSRKATDGFICMYHDQGHIPLKALAFDSAVNVTLGLPIVRTSVDHGTAFDIAWQGKANPGSIRAAAELAVKLVHQQA